MQFDADTAGDLVAATERMKTLARAVLGSEHDAEDAAQDAWCRALSLGTVARRSEAWLAGVARNVAREKRRSSMRRRSREAAVSQPEMRAADHAAHDQIDSLHALVTAVRALDEPYRSALLLRYVVGLSPADAAEALAIKRATLRSHVHRGLALVRAQLAQRDRRAGGAWSAAIAPLLSGGPSTSIAGGLVMSKSASLVGASVLILLLSIGAYTLMPKSEPNGATAASPQDMLSADGEHPQLTGRAARPGAGGEVAPDESSTPAGGSRDTATTTPYSLRVVIRPENPSIEYDHGASWVYAVLESVTTAPRGVTADGVRAPWLRGAEAVTLGLPSAGPWIVGVNTDWGIAPPKTVEFGEAGNKEVLLVLPDPEAQRRRPIEVVVEHEGIDSLDEIQPVVRLAPKHVATRTYSTFPRRGEFPLPRSRSTPVEWDARNEIPCHTPGPFDVSVVLTSTDRSKAAALLVGPTRIEAAPGDSVRFKVRQAGTVILNVTGLANSGEGVPLPRFQLRPADPAEAGTARAKRNDTTGGLSFTATPGTWDLTWAGRGWESGAERGILLRAGSVQVQQVDLVRSDEPWAAPPTNPVGDRKVDALRMRSKYPLRIEGLSLLGRAADRGFDLYALARDGKDRQHALRAAWVEVEREGDLLPVEDLSSVSGLDDDWTALDAFLVVRLPWMIARPDGGLSPGRSATARLTRGGFLVVVPSRYPKDVSLRLSATDGGMITTVHPERWREKEPEGIDQAGRSVSVGPGTMIGPLPPGEYEFEVLLGGAAVGKVRSRVQAGRIGAMAIDLGGE